MTRPTPELPPLEVYMLGLVDFMEVQQLQRRIVYDLGEQSGAVLILCEHRPDDQRRPIRQPGPYRTG